MTGNGGITCSRKSTHKYLGRAKKGEEKREREGEEEREKERDTLTKESEKEISISEAQF